MTNTFYIFGALIKPSGAINTIYFSVAKRMYVIFQI